jgi:hypothetical protein
MSSSTTLAARMAKRHSSSRRFVQAALRLITQYFNCNNP